MTIPSLATTLHRVFSSFSRTVPQLNTTPDKADDVSVTQGFVPAYAQAEGWDVFDCGLRDDGSICREIQCLDSTLTSSTCISPRHAGENSPACGRWHSRS